MVVAMEEEDDVVDADLAVKKELNASLLPSLDEFRCSMVVLRDSSIVIGC